jgi:hypothetical protein
MNKEANELQAKQSTPDHKSQSSFLGRELRYAQRYAILHHGTTEYHQTTRALRH